MKALSMLRPELVSLSVLLFIQMYSYTYRKATAKIFRMTCWAAIAHLVFDILTVLTVNNFLVVPTIVNDIFHYVFYITAMIYCSIYLDYIAAQTVTVQLRQYISSSCKLLILLYSIASPFMGVYYTENSITNYSGGVACMVVMGSACAYFISAIILLGIRRKRVEHHVFVTIMTATMFMMICVVVQLVIPTFLFTGCGIMMATMGMFFAIENPVKYYQQRAFMDISTGVKNKNCFFEDIKDLEAKNEDKKITIVLGDINWLKYVNDKFGHMTGDELICRTGEVLTNSFSDVYNIYRFGGDEFVILFIDKDDDVLDYEINIAYAKCKELEYKNIYPFSISLGYATSYEFKDNNFDVQRIIVLADKRMYSAKAEIKASHPEYDFRKEA